MGLISDATTRLKNALGDLFPEERPSAAPLFPQINGNPINEPTITIRKSSSVPVDSPNPESKFKGFPSSHPYVTNADGSKSNVKLATVGIGDKTFVIPTMVEGKDLPIKEAVRTARNYGLSNYPSFANPKEAENWSKKYHGSIDERGKLMPSAE